MLDVRVGRSVFPAADGLVRHTETFGKLFLSPAELLSVVSYIFADLQFHVHISLVISFIREFIIYDFTYIFNSTVVERLLSVCVSQMNESA